MEKRYKIGNVEFDTYEEYICGRMDVRKIYKITHSVDIYDPDTALRLYEAIRAKKIKFYSKIGRQFFVDLANIVADGAVAEKKRQTKDRRKKKKKEKRIDRSRLVLGGVCFVAAIACFVWYFWSDYTNYRGDQINDYLKSLKQTSEETQETVEMISNDELFLENAPELVAAAAALELEDEDADAAQGTGGTQDFVTAQSTDGSDTAQSTDGTQSSDTMQSADVSDTVQSAGTKEVLAEYAAIYQENRRFAGWITIEGTQIDYPVMLSRGSTDYYLDHNFYGEEDINGTLFMDPRTDLADRSTNIIIYGHNMNSGAMFGGLKQYLSEDYFNSHKEIAFDTIYEKGTYEIFAVCLAQVQYQDSDEFRYYDFIQADTEEEFLEFLENVVEPSVFVDENQLPEYGDELLTLSTCNSYVEDGRLFLVAKKCRDAT